MVDNSKTIEKILNTKDLIVNDIQSMINHIEQEDDKDDTTIEIIKVYREYRDLVIKFFNKVIEYLQKGMEFFEIEKQEDISFIYKEVDNIMKKMKLLKNKQEEEIQSIIKGLKL